MVEPRTEGTTVRRGGTFRVEPGEANRDPSLVRPENIPQAPPGESGEAAFAGKSLEGAGAFLQKGSRKEKGE